MKPKENTFLAIKTTKNLIFHKQNCMQIQKIALFTVWQSKWGLKIGYKEWGQNDKKSHCLLQTKQIYLSSGKTQKIIFVTVKQTKYLSKKTTQNFKKCTYTCRIHPKFCINLQLHNAQKRVNSQLQVKSISQHCIYIDFAKKVPFHCFALLFPNGTNLSCCTCVWLTCSWLLHAWEKMPLSIILTIRHFN